MITTGDPPETIAKGFDLDATFVAELLGAPVVLVVSEIFGVHEHIKDMCRRFAKRGYLAIAPELYARQGDVSKIASELKKIAKSQPGSVYVKDQRKTEGTNARST